MRGDEASGRVKVEHALITELKRDWTLVRGWPARRWAVAAAASALAALLMGIPTGVVQTPFYTRMTPVVWWDYPVWVASSLLVGAIAATYVASARRQGAAGTVGGGVVATFAIGCPICNKLAVALLGVSGALDYWAPLQPVIGVAAVAGLALGLAVRLRGDRTCAPAGLPQP